MMSSSMRQRSSFGGCSQEEVEEQRQALVDDSVAVKGNRRHGALFNHSRVLLIIALMLALVGGTILFLNAHDSSNDVPLSSTSDSSSSSSYPLLLAPQWQSIVADSGWMYPLMVKQQQHEQQQQQPPPPPAWKLCSTDGVYTDIHVTGEPGDVISDLMKAGILDEPYFDSNFLSQMEIWAGNVTFTRTRPTLGPRNRTWVYTTEFTLPQEILHNNNNNTTILLVAEGIKMGASLHVNDHHHLLGNVTNQFLRYEFVLSTTKATTKNTLSITFDPSISTNGRFVGCSGGWDWAPYIPISDDRGSRLWTFGIFRELYLVAVEQVYIAHVVPKVYYTGGHVTIPMVHGPEADFCVLVEVHVISPGRDYHPGDDGEMVVELQSDFGPPTTLALPPLQADTDTIVQFNITVSKDDIELWWPNGMGAQPLYSLNVRLKRASDGSTRPSPAIYKRIGFRTAALVTINDLNETAVQEASHVQGSGTHGMYFRINGALVWSRGGNMVPMDQLEGRLSDTAHTELVRSAAAANMNMLRIWGGGMVLPQAFYDACDEEGILLFHDMMFVEEHNHGALQHPTVTKELQHLIRSLASHASIVLWNGCNECSSMKLFASYVMRVVADEDDTRAIWPSSPSMGGWATGVRRIDGRPNGNTLTIARRGRNGLEKHSPYGHSYSDTFPSVNSVKGRIGTNTPPRLSSLPIGPMYQNQFSSEFGSSVMSSFESMSGTLSEENWNIHGKGYPARCIRVLGHDLECTGKNVMSQRNYACDSHIINYFGSIPFVKEFGARAFQAQLYECMMGQALWMKGQFEYLRSQSSFGALIWQLNENWPTGGWGSIEYGTPSVPGQVIGGRWKPLMHMFQNSLLCDVFAACGEGNQCFVRNDGIESIDAQIQFEYWNLTKPLTLYSSTRSVSLEGGKAATERFELDDRSELSQADVILIRVQDERDGTVLMKDNAFLRAVPKDIPGLTTQNVTITTVVSPNDNGSASITLQSDFLALYVTLTTSAQGRFSENALHLRPSQDLTVEFLAVDKNDVNVTLLSSTLRVEHLGMYLGR